MAKSKKAWQPDQEQDAPKKVAAKKTSKKKEPETVSNGTNKDGNIAGEKVSFEQVIAGMRKQNQPVIERSQRRKRK